VPAGVDDLDFAQDLLQTFGVVLPENEAELQQRSEARKEYHDFLAEIAQSGLGAPHAVRKDMDDWSFDSAMSRISESRRVYESLLESDRLLPEANLIPIVKAQFEAAADETELDAVKKLGEDILQVAQELGEPLDQLQQAMPPTWTMPLAVMNAIGDLRVDEVRAAIRPAVTAAEAISSADAALPQARFLERYKERFENSRSTSELSDLADEAASDQRRATAAGRALQALQATAGDWAIPAAVTTPLESGDLQAGIAIIEDAQAVITAAKSADAALPQANLQAEFQPQFEAVTSGAEMAALRELVEARAAEAKTLGKALQTLEDLVPDWVIPAVVADPVAAGDFAGAVDGANAAASWVTAASVAQALLPQLDALERIRDDFENAQSIEELTAGAAKAQKQADAANAVNTALQRTAEKRDMLTEFGLWGVDVDAIAQQALSAAEAGDVDKAYALANEAIRKLDSGASDGSLRLAGIIFFGIAVLGVLGLWIILRRQAGPSWARSTKPHWIEDGRKRRLLGSGRKQEDGNKKKDGRKK